MGYATEVAQASVKFGIETLGLDRFVALIYPENKASVKVLEKVGFGFVGASDMYYDTMMDVYELVKA
jgi:RimJ/RimL family protein N-acetyltransferase